MLDRVPSSCYCFKANSETSNNAHFEPDGRRRLADQGRLSGDSVVSMSLWTPDGERPVPPAPSDTPDPEPELTPEQQEQAKAMAHELAEARARLLETEVSTVLANHALGIYELAAIHLTADEPNLPEAQLAIDCLAAIVEGLAGRLGEGEATLTEALHQARLAFVQRSSESAPTEDG